VWKVSGEGTTLWAVRGGGSRNERAYAVAMDRTNAVVAVGHSDSDTATFGGVVLTNNDVSSNVGDAVVWKMSADGTTLWAVRGGGTRADYVIALATDSANAVVVAGHFYSLSATFGEVALNKAGSTSYSDAYILQ